MELPQAFAEIDKKACGMHRRKWLWRANILYAFMPYSDIGKLRVFEVFLDYAENGVYLWKEKLRGCRTAGGNLF